MEGFLLRMFKVQRKRDFIGYSVHSFYGLVFLKQDLKLLTFSTLITLPCTCPKYDTKLLTSNLVCCFNTARLYFRCNIYLGYTVLYLVYRFFV